MGLRLTAIARSAALALALLAAGAVPAQQAPPPPSAQELAAARELLRVSGAAKQFDAVVPTLMGQLADLFVKQQPQHERVIRDTFAAMLDRMSTRRSDLIEEVAGLYARRLTAAEMGELARFYGSGTGKKFIDLQPEIVQDSIRIGRRWGERIGREIEIEMRRELRAKGVPF